MISKGEAKKLLTIIRSINTRYLLERARVPRSDGTIRGARVKQVRWKRYLIHCIRVSFEFPVVLSCHRRVQLNGVGRQGHRDCCPIHSVKKSKVEKDLSQFWFWFWKEEDLLCLLWDNLEDVVRAEVGRNWVLQTKSLSLTILLRLHLHLHLPTHSTRVCLFVCLLGFTKMMNTSFSLLNLRAHLWPNTSTFEFFFCV